MYVIKNKKAVCLGIVVFLLFSLACNALSSMVNGIGGEGELEATQPALTPTPARPEPQAGPDSDGDWVSDLDEAKFGTDSTFWDTDDDGLSDFEEIFIVGSNPILADEDSDDDGLPDIMESELFGSDPNLADEDRDGDGIPDAIELQNGSDPGKMDTDEDLLSDFVELYLTETEPVQADAVNGLGYPVPLEPWLPLHLQNVACQAEVTAVIDELDVVDAEEWDSGNDIIVGDEATINYGLWVNALTFSNLDFQFANNPNSNRVVGSLVETQYTDFASVGPVTASCGDSVTFAFQALEDDAPWGGVWDMGLWREPVFLVFRRIPMEAISGSSWVVFEGTTHDGDYIYEIDFSVTVQMNEGG